MEMKRSMCLLATALTAASLLTSPVAASTVLNINFDSSNVGDAVPTNPSTSTPVTQVYAVLGNAGLPGESDYGMPFPYVSGTATIQNVGGLTKAAVLKTNADYHEMGAVTMDTEFAVQARQFALSFDFDVLAATAAGPSQTKLYNGSAVPIIFGASIFTYQGTGPRFVVSPTSETTGLFGFRDPTNTYFTPFGSYVVGEVNHIDILANFNTGTLNASQNGVQQLTNYAFSNTGYSEVTVGEVFFHLNGSENFSNEVAIDNIQAAPVPLPAAAWAGMSLLTTLGATSKLRSLLRRKSA